MPTYETENIIAPLLILFEQYVDGKIDKQYFVSVLKQMEGTHWHFTLDGHKLFIRDIRNPKKGFLISGDHENRITSREIELQQIDLSEKILAKFKKKIIAISGTARGLTSEQQCLAKPLIHLLLDLLNPKEHAVLTGGFPENIPGETARIAKDRGFTTLAILPEVAFNVDEAFDPNLYNHIVIAGRYWGEETKTFVGVASMIFFIGGGPWTEIEYEEAQRRGIPKYFLEGFGRFSQAMASTAPTIQTFEINGKQIRMTGDP